MDRFTDAFSPDLQQFIDVRVMSDGFADAKDYLETLVRQDQVERGQGVECLRDMIAEGLASGIIDREPEDVLDAIMAEDPDLRG